MDSRGIAFEAKIVCPVLFMPKCCTTLMTPCNISDDIFLETNITIVDFDGQEARLFKGFCNFGFIDDDDQSLSTMYTDHKQAETLNHKIDSSPSRDPKVWIDPNRNPYLNGNYYKNESQTTNPEEDQKINKLNNQYIYQNVPGKSIEPFEELENKLKKWMSSNKVYQQSYSPVHENINENNVFESCVFLTQPEPETKDEEALLDSQAENCALKQLMSPETNALNKQQKTILFLDHENHGGKTIQMITVNSPSVECISKAVTEVETPVETDQDTTKKKYQCDKCKQIFDQLATFKQHMVNHWNKAAERPSDRDDQYMCSQCGKKLKSREKFEKHCLGHGDPELECDKCFKVFASKFTLRTHRKIHMRKYPCEHCTKTFSKLLELKAHAAKTHSVYNFDTSQYTASDQRELEIHQLSQEEFGSEVKELEMVSGITMSDPAPENSVIPPHVKEQMSSEDNDREDVNKKDADAIISKVMSNNIFLLNSNMARKQKKYNKNCVVCNKSFDRIGDLKRHLIEHVVTNTLSKNPVDENGTLSIKCQICQAKVFTKTDKFKEHLREHAKLTLYQCTSCNKSFSDSSNFSKHKKIHGSRYFQCDLCQRKFNSKKMIMLHMDYHNKNAPLDCSYCDKKFYFKSMLNKHIKYTHAKDTSTRFRCQFCHGYYKTLKEKWDHEWQVHKVRKNIADCYVCDSKFRKYSELKRHCSVWHNLNIPSANK